MMPNHDTYSTLLEGNFTKLVSKSQKKERKEPTAALNSIVKQAH